MSEYDMLIYRVQELAVTVRDAWMRTEAPKQQTSRRLELEQKLKVFHTCLLSKMFTSHTAPSSSPPHHSLPSPSSALPRSKLGEQSYPLQY
jgi:hypothetical protein